MRFLRTASTGRLLGLLAAVIVVIGGGSAIAVAATTSDPVPPAAPPASAIHRALTAPKVSGISADITFTDNLVDSSDFTGQGTDPLLQGASGRLWLTADGRLRIELQSDNGDTEIVVDHRRFSISDPAQHTVYEGTLPAGMGGSSGSSASSGAGGQNGDAIPSIAQIQSELTRLMASADVSGAQPTDVADQGAYRISISPKSAGGLVGSAQLAWDAATGVPLDLAVYARGDSTPVLELKATHISYGTVPDSDVDVAPPAGSKVVQLGGGSAAGTSGASGSSADPTAPDDHSALHGLQAVSAAVPFTLHAPDTLAGRSRGHVSLIGHSTALITYGTGLGAIAVIESRAASGSGSGSDSSSAGGSGAGGLSLPTPTINGVTATELSTPLGTVLHLTRGGVAETVLGSVPGSVAVQAAGGL